MERATVISGIEKNRKKATGGGEKRKDKAEQEKKNVKRLK
jgi:hypothetical protein